VRRRAATTRPRTLPVAGVLLCRPSHGQPVPILSDRMRPDRVLRHDRHGMRDRHILEHFRRLGICGIVLTEGRH
jgi:hypothetical protein